MNTFSYYFNIEFPLKFICVGSTTTNKWITKGLITSRNKLKLLCNMKRTTNLPAKLLMHIKKYQLVFRKVVKEAKKKKADRPVLSTKNKNMALWKLINKESGNSQQNCSIIIHDGENIITNPQTVSDRFNTFFTEVTEELLSQNNYHCLKQSTKFRIKNCSKTMFIAPVTEIELEEAIKGLKTNSAAGVDEIPMPVVKQCLGYFLKPLAHIYKISFQAGNFPGIMKN
jgi:hypothetical protein